MPLSCFGSVEEAARFAGGAGLPESDPAGFESPGGWAFARIDRDGAYRSFSEVKSTGYSNVSLKGARVRQPQLTAKAIGSASAPVLPVSSAGLAIRFASLKPYFQFRLVYPATTWRMASSKAATLHSDASPD